MPPATDTDAMREGACGKRHERGNGPAGRGYRVPKSRALSGQPIEVGCHTGASGIAQGVGTKTVGNDQDNNHARETNSKPCAAPQGFAQNLRVFEDAAGVRCDR